MCDIVERNVSQSVSIKQKVTQISGSVGYHHVIDLNLFGTVQPLLSRALGRYVFGLLLTTLQQ